MPLICYSKIIINAKYIVKHTNNRSTVETAYTENEASVKITT